MPKKKFWKKILKKVNYLITKKEEEIESKAIIAFYVAHAAIGVFTAGLTIKELYTRYEQRVEWKKHAPAVVVAHNKKNNSIEYEYIYKNKKYNAKWENDEIGDKPLLVNSQQTSPSSSSLPITTLSSSSPTNNNSVNSKQRLRQVSETAQDEDSLIVPADKLFFSKFPIGHQMEIYLNPSNPQQSCLRRYVEHCPFITLQMVENVLPYMGFFTLIRGLRRGSFGMALAGCAMLPSWRFMQTFDVIHNTRLGDYLNELMNLRDNGRILKREGGAADSETERYQEELKKLVSPVLAPAGAQVVEKIVHWKKDTANTKHKT